ncbi:hypothetical protein ACLB2K_027109 [Fragaria x ananassa]
MLPTKVASHAQRAGAGSSVGETLPEGASKRAADVSHVCGLGWAGLGWGGKNSPGLDYSSSLDYCESIIDLSMLKSLKKLEILSIRGCDIRKFPKEIGQLTNLRMLDLTNIGDIDGVPSQVISRLHRLEELYMKCKFGDWGSKASEETIVFPELKNFIFKDLPQLTRFCSPTSVDIEFPSLEHLYVRDCPQLSTSASDFQSKNHVVGSRMMLREETVVSDLVLFNLLCMLPGLAGQQGFADKMSMELLVIPL